MATTTTTANAADIKHLDATAEMIDKHSKDASTTGISNSISSWIKTLENYDGLQDIASNLEKLKAAISAKDTKEIVALMTGLGEATTKAADQADANDSKHIKNVGKSLTAGAKLIKKLM